MIFYPFTPPKNHKNQNFEKNEKNCLRYHHFTHVQQKLLSYDAQFLRYGVRPTDFLSFYPSNNLENQNVEKNEKKYHHFTYVYQNHDHLVYASWDMKCNTFFFLVILRHFCSFIPLITWKIKVLKKWKRSLEILSFYTCVP